MRLTPEELEELHRLDAALHADSWEERVDHAGNRRLYAPPRAVLLDHNTLHRYRKQAKAVAREAKALGLGDGQSAT